MSAPSPEGIEVHARHLVVDGVRVATLAVCGYPAEVVPGWLETFTAYPGRLDVALHFEPIPAQVAADRLRRRRTRLEAGRRESAGRGQLEDPAADAAAQDAAELAHRVARAQTKLFHAALYLTCYAESAEALDHLVGEVKALLSASLTTAQLPTFRMQDAWCATLPAGPDHIRRTQVLDTAALSACTPLTSPDTRLAALSDASAGAVLVGLSAATGAPVFHSRWTQENHNSVILGSSGAGKSFLAKCDLIRSLCAGIECTVIDPEGEYAAIAEAVGGRIVRLGTPGAGINPLALPEPMAADPCPLATRVLELHSLTQVLLGADRAERLRAAVDRAAMGAYRDAGLTDDPASWTVPTPDFAAVVAQAQKGVDAASAELADALAPYATGSYASLFTAAEAPPTGVPLTVYTLADLPDALRTPAMFLVLAEIWRISTRADRRRLLVIDEAWQLLQDPAAAQYVFRIAKSARKDLLGLSLVTQDAGDLLGSELGRAVACNSATQILLRQAPQALTQAADAFALSAGERDFLATAPRGAALVRTTSGRAAVMTVATPAEAPFLHTGL